MVMRDVATRILLGVAVQNPLDLFAEPCREPELVAEANL